MDGEGKQLVPLSDRLPKATLQLLERSAIYTYPWYLEEIGFAGHVEHLRKRLNKVYCGVYFIGRMIVIIIKMVL